MTDKVLVLVVDDEPLILQMVEDALVDAGYAVVTAPDAEQAITAMVTRSVEVHALVSDIDLFPGRLTGWDVARHARKLVPNLPVVYMTGHGAGQWSSLGVPGSILVAKPFAIGQIVTAVSQLITAARIT